jgi:predicted RNA-binding Zn ribbon-like protein
MAQPLRDDYTFELVGGRLCLDFVNTLNGSRTTGETEEKLPDYAALVSWARQAGAIPERAARTLAQAARARPRAAAAVLTRAIELRETLYRIFAAAAAERAPAQADLAALNDALGAALAHAQLARTKEGFTWTWRAEEAALDEMLWPVVRDAAELLTADELGRARVCDADECTWLFLDLSKNRSRRWCDMKYCGNRAKARRHYARHRAAPARH